LRISTLKEKLGWVIGATVSQSHLQLKDAQERGERWRRREKESEGEKELGEG
jgi:hypothetical protein